MERTDKTKPESENESPERPRRVAEVERRYEAVSRIVSTLNTDLPVDHIMLEVGSILQDLIPFDRLSLGLLSQDRWYYLQDGDVSSREYFATVTPMVEDYSATRWVILNQQPLLRQNISKEHRFKRDSIQIDEGMFSDLIVPLVVDEEVVGTFNFTSREPNRYHEDHLEIAQSVADTIAVAVKQLQARQEMEAIREISTAVQGSLDLDEVLKMILTHIRSQGYDRVRLYLYEKEQDALRGAVQVGRRLSSKFTSILFPLETDPCSKQTLASNRPQTYQAGWPEYTEMIRRRKEDGTFTDFERKGSEEWCEIPLKVTEEGRKIIVGKISLDNLPSKRSLIQERLDRLMLYASQATIAIRHAQLHRQMAEQVEIRTAELHSANEELRARIAERKQIEQELVRLERLRALGEMSAGVSHNLNNLLTGILGPAQLIQIHSDDPRVIREAAAIVGSSQRAADLVNRLHLAVRNEEETETEPVAVNRAVQEAVETARPRWKDEAEAGGITIDVAIDLGDVPPIEGTKAGLHDILLNLLFNAVDALPEGGAVQISTTAVDGGVRLMVSDSGIGMDEETRRRVFEPFFTTKMNVGTGLGLSVVYGAVNRWGGRIDVQSAPGRGTTFTIEFPAWKGPEPEESEVTEEKPAPDRPAHRGKVLIVENDTIVGQFLSRLLSGNYCVETALSGQEALKRFAPGRFDVALIDLGMPGMSGDQLARKLRQGDPSLSLVLVTGWNLEEDDPRLSAFDFLLQKPIDNLDRVRNVVAQSILRRELRSKQST